jgi:hypothetical protein
MGRAYSRCRKIFGVLLGTTGWAVLMASSKIVYGPHRQAISDYVLFIAVAAVGMVISFHGLAMAAGKRLHWFRFGPWQDY